jgi:hypothetical protein
MQTYIIFVLLLSSGTASAGLEKVLKVAQFIANIYQLLRSRCIFIIYSEAQQHGELEVCIIYISCVVLGNRHVYTEFGRGSAYELPFNVFHVCAL